MNTSRRIPIPAASVLALRGDPALRVLMVRRSRRLRSWSGLWVFPGGRIERDEDPLSAAVRELFEETGLLLVDGAHRPLADLERLRRSVESGDIDFCALLRESNLSVASERLVPVSRWITPSMEPRRFDAQFYLADVSDWGSERLDAVVADANETVEERWWLPSEALSAYRLGEIELAPPTIRQLEDLERWANPSRAVLAAQSRPSVAILPKIVGSERAQILLPWDLEYQGAPGEEVTWDAEIGPVFGPSRFVQREGIWHSDDFPVHSV